MGLRRFEESKNSLTKVLTLPTSMIHLVHVHAFKKLTLISLLLGREFKMPQNVGAFLSRVLRLENAQ